MFSSVPAKPPAVWRGAGSRCCKGRLVQGDLIEVHRAARGLITRSEPSSRLDSAEGARQADAPPEGRAARCAPLVGSGTRMTGDTFFHGSGMSAQAQYIATLYGAAAAAIAETEAAAVTLAITRHGRDEPRDHPVAVGHGYPLQ